MTTTTEVAFAIVVMAASCTSQSDTSTNLDVGAADAFEEDVAGDGGADSAVDHGEASSDVYRCSNDAYCVSLKIRRPICAWYVDEPAAWPMLVPEERGEYQRCAVCDYEGNGCESGETCLASGDGCI